MRGGGYKKVPQASANPAIPEPVSNPTRPAARASMGRATMKVVSSPGNDQALTNMAYCSANDIKQFPNAPGHCRMILASNLIPSRDQVQIVLAVESDDKVVDGTLALNAYHRKNIRVSTTDEVLVESFKPGKGSDLAVVRLDIQFVKYRENREIKAPELTDKIMRQFAGQVLTVGQMVSVEFVGTNYYFTVKETMFGRESPTDSNRGVLKKDETVIMFESAGNSGIKITSQKGGANTNLFKAKDFNFQKLGIGGLDAEFQDIFRRAFASRVFPPDVMSKLGIQHVKGMLLWGPPGTGKTLIARQIGKMLNGREPKIVNGPEVLSKFVGETEKNVRDLFADAEKEQREQGDQSELHIIIFDEIDAICKSRGSTRDGTGVHDSIVNQLLTKIDGVESLNNILLIGMTNRKDMLDEALLRPGRLEVQIEIGLPDERGRIQILKIHTSKMRESSFLPADVSLELLASQTKNFSGAELEGLVKSAVSFALDRQVDFEDLSKPLDEDNIKVTMDDFMAALHEVKPAFGAAVASLERCRVNSMLNCGPENSHIQRTALSLVEQLRTSERTPLLSCLLEGPSGSGKTALAATVGIDSAEHVPFVKIISAETMVGLSESTKCGMINKVFEDAYKSPLSIIILDDIERILEFVNIGPRFSNLILQTLLVLVKRLPPENRKLLVIGTTSMKDVMLDMNILSAFNVALYVPLLKPNDMRTVLQGLNVFTPADLDTVVENLPEEGMPIKKLLMLVEMSKQGGGDHAIEVDAGEEKININRFLECYNDLS